MPPAASPNVSENRRLITSPSPIACSTIERRMIPELEHDLFPQSDDVADADHHALPLDEIDDALADRLRALAAEVAEAVPREAVLDGERSHQLGASAREHDVVRVNPSRDELRQLLGALQPVRSAVCQ